MAEQPPDTIFLQWHGDSEPQECEYEPHEVTWSRTEVFEADVQYVRRQTITELEDAAQVALNALTVGPENMRTASEQMAIEALREALDKTEADDDTT